MAVPSNQFRSKFTQRLLRLYRETPQPTGFLKSFFPESYSGTLYVSIEVQRNGEPIATDIHRNASDGNYNESSISTQKIIEPPHYWETVGLNNNDLYETAMGQENARLAGRMLRQHIQREQQMAVNKIMRAYELQAAQVLEDGIVTLQNSDNIDFKRKADSKQDANTDYNGYWDGAADPFSQLEEGCQFIRQEGKFSGGVMNCVMGQDAFRALVNNETFLDRNDRLGRFGLDQARSSQRNAEGGVPKMTLTVGAWTVNVWTYPQYYTNSSNNSVPYFDQTKVILMPDEPTFDLGYALVPQLPDANGRPQQSGPIFAYDSIDTKRQAHEFHNRSAGICVPTAVDQIWTLKAVA